MLLKNDLKKMTQKYSERRNKFWPKIKSRRSFAARGVFAVVVFSTLGTAVFATASYAAVESAPAAVDKAERSLGLADDKIRDAVKVLHSGQDIVCLTTRIASWSP